MLNPNEDTEWNDILRAKGILPPKENLKEPEPEPINRRDVINKYGYDELTHKLEKLEDRGLDSDDSGEFLAAYRLKRMQEMKEMANKPTFATYSKVSKVDWVQEVNNAPKGVHVVIHIAEQGNEFCGILDDIFAKFALKFLFVKFLRGEHSMCIPSYPSSNIPTLFVYKDSILIHKLIGLSSFGGPKSIELKLNQWGVINTAVNTDMIDPVKKNGFINKKRQNSSDSE